MKILYFSPHPHLNLSDPSGYGTHMREMIASFKKLGHTVETLIIGGEEHQDYEMGAFTSNPFKKIIKKLVPRIIWNTIKDNQFIRLDISNQQLLEAAIQELQPDLIYERGAHLFLSGVQAAKKYNIKHFLEINAPFWEEKLELEGARLLKKRADNREYKLLSQTDKLFVVSSPLKDYFCQKHSVPKTKAVVIPNAVSKKDVNINSEITKQINFFLNENSIVLGFVGSIFPYHGVEDIIRLLPKLIEYEPNCRLLIVGDGYILNDLKKLAKNLGVYQYTLFTGNVPYVDVFSYISLMDITLLPNTKWYCSPVKIFEYGKMGKIIVSVDKPSVRDVITNKKTGFLFSVKQENSMEKTIIQVLENMEEAKKIAHSFRQQIKEDHLWDTVAQKTLSYF